MIAFVLLFKSGHKVQRTLKDQTRNLDTSPSSRSVPLPSVQELQRPSATFRESNGSELVRYEHDGHVTSLLNSFAMHSQDADVKAGKNRLKPERREGHAGNNEPHCMGIVEVAEMVQAPLVYRQQQQHYSANQR